MASRIALFLMCLSLCVTAAHGEVSSETDPHELIIESFSKLEKETCATALMCLWLEVVQLPRRRMIERIDTIFKRFRGLVNISAERAKLENDGTFNNMSDAREALNDIYTKLEAAQKLESRLEGAKQELRAGLEKDDTVVSNLNDALVSISMVVSGLLGKLGTQTVSLTSIKKDMQNMTNYTQGMEIANNTVKAIMETWWNGNTASLINNLTKLIKNSSTLCDKHVYERKIRYTYSYFHIVDYSKVIAFIRNNTGELINYTNTIGSIDRFDERQRGASGNITKKLLASVFAKQLEDMLNDMNALKVSVREIRKARAQLLVAKQKNEEERRHGCTDLWSQLLTLVRLR
ncbi:hypothetical protein ERJ75_000412500 [Trypanosoma vivax]|uniref:Uncharacterized protein n=1 Tax=Trypanosoma vivax (strain Y486) TaxID=1055687 RepID=F9WSE6_TRYVY|nr:hypothetical protein TRVL_06746 [Trypanosoma vivax]KAH8617060.1 hypothetical protein ERJ75_000412500 [Trypanosoma vivax]CCD20485.1 hypothetical protein, conserved in T. vivax [Trypanosoma vivax Y486]|eukprot:CCD20485.1 hypothetical protein, conserved in T. vivax [Trypanosoma vivax Y486]